LEEEEEEEWNGDEDVLLVGVGGEDGAKGEKLYPRHFLDVSMDRYRSK
jgi:hypothetical protein